MKKIGVLNKLTRESPDLTKTLSQAMWEYTFQEKLKNKSELIREGLEKALRKEVWRLFKFYIFCIARLSSILHVF